MRRRHLRPFGEGRLACYLRARLHRRLFLWFAAAILTSGLAALAVGRLSGSGGDFSDELDGLRSLVAERFERVWDDEAERDRFATSIAHDLRVGVTLEDTSDKAIAAFGGTCSGARFTVPIERGGNPLGRVTLCRDERRAGHPTHFFLALFAACAVLWAIAGKVSRRISRPLVELSRVAQEIGAGRYDARARLHRHDGEVGAVGAAINDMAAKIEKQMADQRELLATVSHEIRTPLSRIRLLTEMAREDPKPASRLDGIDEEVVAIDALVGELLASSRLDFSALSRAEMSAAEAAARALERAGLGAQLLRDDSKGARISADATLLSRALANLIENAEEHGGGLVALRVSESEDHVVFAAEDAGPGIAKGEETRVFEAFYRRPKSPEHGSMGLGLALVKRIAEAHGGSASAENREGGGASVQMRWRKAPEASPHSGAPDSTRRHGDRGGSRRF